MRSALDGLRALRKECDRRAAVIREMDREQCPEFKVTSAVANTPSLHLLIMALDEVQELMTHSSTANKQGSWLSRSSSSAARLGSS